MTADYDLCVIGGGAAGLVVAAGGASLGAKVVLIEKRALGGDCLRYGCVPSKALLRSARVAHVVRTAGRFGLSASEPQIQLGAVMERVARVIQTLEPQDSPDRLRSLGAEVIFGAGEFSNPRTFRVNGRTITARYFVIATGSRPAIPALPGLDSVPYLTNETIFELREPVPALIVLGGGPIGVEMAQAFARLGSKVCLIEAGAQILSREDSDVVQVLAAQLIRDGVDIHTDSRAIEIQGKPGEILLRLEHNGLEAQVAGTHLLVAAGRRLNIDELGLAAAGIDCHRGRIITNERLRTSNRRVFVCGDAAAGLQFTHLAEHQAGIVLRNTLFHGRSKVERNVIPWCTFTDPEVARVGLSEAEARARGLRHEMYKFSFAEIDRAQTDGETDGFAKILTDRRGRLLGAAIVGAHAGDLIAEYTLALAKRMKAADLSAVIHVYPTLAQINRRVADLRLKRRLTPRTRRWLQRLFRLRGAR